MRRLPGSSLFPIAAAAWVGFLVYGPELLQIGQYPVPVLRAPNPLPLPPAGLVSGSLVAAPAEPPLMKLPFRVREHLDLADRAPTSLHFPGDRRAQPDERRDYHRRMIEKYPDSADVHYEFARYLAAIDDYDGAGRELLETFRCDPLHARGAAMAPILLRLRASKSPLERVQGQLDLNALDIPAPVAATPPELQITSEEQARIDEDRRAVRAKYASLLANGKTYEPTAEEQLRATLPLQYEIDGSSRQAEDAHRRLLTDFAASPLVRAEYVRFLLRQHRYTDAERVLAAELRRFPAQLELTIIRDHVSAASTDEARARVDDDIRYDLSLLATQ